MIDGLKLLESKALRIYDLMKANACSICTSCLLQSLHQLHQMLSSREVGCLCRAKKDSTIILFSSTMHDIVLVLVKIKGTVYNAH